MPVGEGVIDFKTIFENAKIGGIKHFFVEHDMPKDALASITSSIGYLKKYAKIDFVVDGDTGHDNKSKTVRIFALHLAQKHDFGR